MQEVSLIVVRIARIARPRDRTGGSVGRRRDALRLLPSPSSFRDLSSGVGVARDLDSIAHRLYRLIPRRRSARAERGLTRTVPVSGRKTRRGRQTLELR